MWKGGRVISLGLVGVCAQPFSYTALHQHLKENGMRFNLALIGFGGVNHGLVSVILQKQDMLRERFDVDLRVTAVSDIRLGTVWNPDGLDLQALLDVPASNYSREQLLAATGNSKHGGGELADTLELIKSDCVDVVVEATFTDPNTGEPALSHCRTALEHGKHVITTNKGPIALALRELLALAAEKNVHLLYEGSVMSGTPVLRQISHTLRGCEITGFRGILNGTCNYVLGRVESGLTFDEAVREAQVKGYAEADPTADVDGWDVQLKVTILANALWNIGLKPSQVRRSGISSLTESQVRKGAAEGVAWRLIGQAARNSDGTIDASVGVVTLNQNDPLRAATGATNAVTFNTDLLGKVTITGPGAGRTETAFAVLSDLIDLGGLVAGKQKGGKA